MRIKVTGYVDIQDDEYDPGPLGPLTEEAHMQYSMSLGLDDLKFEEVSE
jgi:hypothetical protein